MSKPSVTWRKYDPAVLVDRFGVMGTAMYLMAHGIDNSEVEERSGISSIGRDTTFQEDTNDFRYILQALDELAEEVHNDLENNNLLQDRYDKDSIREFRDAHARKNLALHYGPSARLEEKR